MGTLNPLGLLFLLIASNLILVNSSHLTLRDPRIRTAFDSALNNYKLDVANKKTPHLMISTGLNDPISDDDDKKSTECISLLQDITNNFLTYNKTIEKIFRNSGKDYNDLGRYEDCLKIKDTEFSYILVSVPHAFPIPIMLGLCMPKVCTVTEFNVFKPYFVNALNQWIPEIFKGIKGFDMNTKLHTSDMQFEDSLKRNEETT